MLNEKQKNKIVMEKISEYLGIRFWDTPLIRDCLLLDFQIRIGRQIPYDPETNIDKEENKKYNSIKRVKKHRTIKKYLSL